LNYEERLGSKMFMCDSTFLTFSLVQTKRVEKLTATFFFYSALPGLAKPTKKKATTGVKTSCRSIKMFTLVNMRSRQRLFWSLAF